MGGEGQAHAELVEVGEQAEEFYKCQNAGATSVVDKVGNGTYLSL